MKKLPPQDQHHLNAAEGWLGLGDHLAANAELEQIRPTLRTEPKVLLVRLQIYLKAEQWATCFDIASALLRLEPSNNHGWIGRSFALHELKRTEEAYDLLLLAKDMFPKNWNVPYNLACYCSQLNRLEEAKDWFKKAVAIDEQTVKSEAIDDPDLNPLWDSMGGIMWKRQ